MPDISMCVNEKCLVKDRCYRYRAIPSEYQSIAFFQLNNNGLCSHFWNITNERVMPLEDSNKHAAIVNSQRKDSQEDV